MATLKTNESVPSYVSVHTIHCIILRQESVSIKQGILTLATPHGWQGQCREPKQLLCRKTIEADGAPQRRADVATAVIWHATYGLVICGVVVKVRFN